MKKGYVQIYTGDGKGKTTAALGLAVRGAGANLNVMIAQFIKGMDTSELNILKNIDNITVLRYMTSKKFFCNMTEDEKKQVKAEMRKLLVDTIKLSKEKQCDIVIFDELLGALHGGFISKEEIVNLLENKPDGCEYVITGRAAPDWLVKRADLVSSIEAVKHYMDAGVNARKGIEF